MDWNLRTCSRTGHVTYAVSDAALQDRLHTDTAQGPAWRCLRCGDYVLGQTAGSGPAEDAPILLRGRALRAAFIERLLAVERVIRGLFTGLLGIGVLQLRSSEINLRQLFDKDLRAAKPLLNQLGWNASDSGLIKSIQDALQTRSSTLTLVGLFLLGYGILQVIEGVGLWLLKRWGEYFAVVSTTAFLPLEIYELTEKVTLLRVLLLLLNIAAVVYLLLSKRLFGLRGGGQAYERELNDESLLEIEASAT